MLHCKYIQKKKHRINYKNPSNCIVIDKVVYMSIVHKCFSSLLLNSLLRKILVLSNILVFKCMIDILINVTIFHMPIEQSAFLSKHF